MASKRRLPTTLAAVAALSLLCVSTVRADNEAALRAKMVELESKQSSLEAEIRELRAKLDAPPPPEPRVAEVERKQNVITEEVRKLREALVLPESKELKSEYGLGPAASKVYGVKGGVSIGSYGEFNYKNVVSDSGGTKDEFDMLRLVLYTGYKFSDLIVFNSEVEFEHGLTGEDGHGEVAVEFANLDVLFDPRINFRAGLVLVPMGFLNEMHEPPFFHGTVRPEVEQRILPSTWNAGGLGFFGELLPGLTYRTYAVTGLDATGFRASGIREGRQEGSIEKAENFAWVGRFDYSPVEMLTLGGSLYLGNSGQGQSFGNATDGYTKPSVFTQIYEAHAQLKIHGFEARVLGAWVGIDDVAALSLDDRINPHIVDATEVDQPVAGSQFGWYGELAYNVLPLLLPSTSQYLAPWFRYSRIDTQNGVASGFAEDASFNLSIFEVGLTYKPISQVVFKLDYRNQDPKTGNLPDEIHLGAGFVY